jgi:hypothetical protein
MVSARVEAPPPARTQAIVHPQLEDGYAHVMSRDTARSCARPTPAVSVLARWSSSPATELRLPATPRVSTPRASARSSRTGRPRRVDGTTRDLASARGRRANQILDRDTAGGGALFVLRLAGPTCSPGGDRLHRREDRREPSDRGRLLLRLRISGRSREHLEAIGGDATRARRGRGWGGRIARRRSPASSGN